MFTHTHFLWSTHTYKKRRFALRRSVRERVAEDVRSVLGALVSWRRLRNTGLLDKICRDPGAPHNHVIITVCSTTFTLAAGISRLLQSARGAARRKGIPKPDEISSYRRVHGSHILLRLEEASFRSLLLRTSSHQERSVHLLKPLFFFSL